MKNRLASAFMFLSALMVSAFTVSCATEQDLYKDEIKRIIVGAQVPLIQLESSFNGERLSYQIENPNFYDSVKIASGEATPKPAVFQAASLSKVVFSYIVMKMYDRGEIDLDAPICTYTDIDRFEDKESASKLTARMVLNHRTGLPNWSTSPSSQEWPTSTITFKYPVDSCYGYSGEGFAFLQRAVEKIIDLATVLQQHNLKLYIISANTVEETQALFEPYMGLDGESFEILYADYKMVISLNRSSGGLTYVNSGIIVEKWARGNYPFDTLGKILEEDPEIITVQAQIREQLFAEISLFVILFLIVIIRFFSKIVYRHRVVSGGRDGSGEVAEAS